MFIGPGPGQRQGLNLLGLEKFVVDWGAIRCQHICTVSLRPLQNTIEYWSQVEMDPNEV